MVKLDAKITIILRSRLAKTFFQLGARGGCELPAAPVKGRRVLSQPEDDLVAYPSWSARHAKSLSSNMSSVHRFAQFYIEASESIM